MEIPIERSVVKCSLAAGRRAAVTLSMARLRNVHFSTRSCLLEDSETWNILTMQGSKIYTGNRTILQLMTTTGMMLRLLRIFEHNNPSQSTYQMSNGKQLVLLAMASEEMEDCDQLASETI